MEVLATTPSAPSAASEKPKSPEEGFDKALDKAQADSAPPGTAPPNKELSTSAGEVAGTEQKTPPQQLDSQPTQGKDAQPSISASNPALLEALGNAIAASKLSQTPANDNVASAPTAEKQGRAISASGPVAISKLEGSVKTPKDQDLDAEDSESKQDFEDPGVGKGGLVGGISHPDLGKVTLKVRKLIGEESEDGVGKGGNAARDYEASPISISSVKADAPNPVSPITLSAPKPLEAVQPQTSVQPLSNERRDLVYKQVADRMELLAASRPREAVTIHLQPQDLGNVTVVIKNAGVKMSAEFFATHDGVRDALKQDSGKLTEQLQAKGVAMTHIAVSHSAAPQQTGSNTHYRDRNPASNANGEPNAQRQNRQQGERRQQDFSPTFLKSEEGARPHSWGRAVTAVDLSI